MSDSNDSTEALHARVAELERRLAETEPALAKLASFEKALETTRAGVTITDPEGVIVYTNSAEAKMHGYDAPADLIGKKARVLAPSDLWDPMSAKKLSSIGPFNRDSVNVRKDGSRFPVYIASDLVRDEQGEAVGVVSICQDISESKKAETELRRAFAELEIQAQESSQELSDALRQLNERLAEQKAAELEKKQLEAELQQAQKMEAVGLLAGGVAHDFNNILTAIVGYSNLISVALPESDPMRGDVSQILQAAERGAGLTQRLLTFSRKQMMDLKPLEVMDLVVGIEKFLRRIIGEDLELSTVLTSEPMTVLADQGQLEQVLVNLATNARDAMPDGGRIEIRTEPFTLDKRYAKYQLLLEPGRYACISVRDTGHGIDKDHLDQIFEPFFTTKEIGSGTGLGLAVSYGIVKQHHGAISVYSEPGEGSVFRVYLPLVDSDAETLEKDIPRPQGGTETILLAEDDESVRHLATRLLVEHGYTVLSADDGPTAVELATHHAEEISLAILDVVLPGKHGPQVAEEIERLKPGLPVLFVSGYTSDVLKARGIDQKRVNYVQKPYDPRALLTIVRTLLDSST